MTESKRAIGGYFTLEEIEQNDHLSDGVFLNSGRNALIFIIRQFKYEKVYIPYYTCSAVKDVLQREKIKFEFYFLSSDLKPDFNKQIAENECLLYNNYFGVFSKKVAEVSESFSNVIIDNAQALFHPFYKSKAKAFFFSPRKFIGMPDGGIVTSLKFLQQNDSLEIDSSFENATHLLKGIDEGREKAYIEFLKSEEIVDQKGLKSMSKLSYALYRKFNFSYLIKKRGENFCYLHEKLKTLNLFSQLLEKEDEIYGPLIYPFWCNNGDKLRDKLIKEKIFIARYWSNVEEWLGNYPNSLELNLSKNLVALPIDQRLDKEDLDRICKSIFEFNLAKI